MNIYVTVCFFLQFLVAIQMEGAAGGGSNAGKKTPRGGTVMYLKSNLSYRPISVQYDIL